MKLWVCFVLFVVLLTIYALIGMKCKIRQTDYKTWSEDIMLKCDYDPSPMTFMDGGAGTRSTIKRGDMTNYVYMNESDDDMENKKTLIYLIANTVSDYKQDVKYYDCVEKLMNEAGIDRTKTKLVL